MQSVRKQSNINNEELLSCPMDDMLPCPFCGSKELSLNWWSMDSGEVDAVECNNCLAGAPLTVWQCRQPKLWQKLQPVGNGI